MRKVFIRSGVSYNEETQTFSFNYNIDDENDILNLNDNIQESYILDNVYYYGYKFKTNVPSDVRTNFIHQLKGLSETKIDDLDFQRFLVYPLIQLGHKELYKFDTLVYPKSERSNINRTLVRYIRAHTRILSENVITFELIKQLPKNIKFDFLMFEEQNNHDERYPKWKKQKN